MKLDIMVEGFLKATDPKTHVTYDMYTKDLIQRGSPPVTPKQWDMIIDMVGSRIMT